MAGSKKSAVEAAPEWIRVNGTATRASLEADGTLQWDSPGGERWLRLESEVLGFATQGARIIIRAFVEEREDRFCGLVGGAAGRRRVRRDYELEMADEEAARRWSARLRDSVDCLGRPKKLFIILNPFSGKKCGRKIFMNEVEPLLAAADIPYDIIETKHRNHAQEIARELDFLQYDGIVCVSGDGIPVEVFNGLLNRKDWATAIKVPLGLIPAGTGNGMAKSLMDSAGDLCSVPNATFAVIRGHKRSLDVATILQNEKKFFSVLLLTWGLVADVDIESEKYRWMGSARVDLYALLRIMNLRKYHGHVHFIPAPGYESYGEPINQISGCECDLLLSKQDREGSGYQGPEVSLEKLEWRSLDGPFISVWVNNVPFSAEDYMPAPKAEFSDGYLDVIIVKDSPKSALLGMMLTMGDGSYVQSPYVMYFKVKAFRLKPGKRLGHATKGGIVDSDGEIIARGDESAECIQGKYLLDYDPPIQMTVDKGLATLFSPNCS